MTTYKQLAKEFEKNVNVLQATCKHKRLSPWMEQMYSPGHITPGLRLRVCETCNEIVYRETYMKECLGCGKKNIMLNWGKCTICGHPKLKEVKVTERLGKVVKEEGVEE